MIACFILSLQSVLDQDIRSPAPLWSESALGYWPLFLSHPGTQTAFSRDLAYDVTGDYGIFADLEIKHPDICKIRAVLESELKAISRVDSAGRKDV